MLERLKEEVGLPFTTTNKFSSAGLNVLWTILAGERMQQDDPKLNALLKLFTTNLADSGSFLSVFAMFVPWTAKYIPRLVKYETLLATVKPTLELLQPHIDYHFETHEPGLPRDFIDAYIDEIKKTDDPTSSFHKDSRE